MIRPALKWYGGKHKIAQWVIGHFPPHVTYVEPFGGAASVLLNKPPATNEVYNDIDGELINFFRVLRDRPGELMRLIELTPYSREEHALAWEVAEAPLERARRFYVRCWQSYGSGARRTAAGWGTEKRPRRGSTNIENWRDIDHLKQIAERLLTVMIENGNALEIMPRFDTPETLFYVDPPYPHNTRYKTDSYVNELTDSDHEALAETLHSLEGMVILSGYDSPLYNALYPSWRKVTTNNTNRRHKSVIESLWLSPAATSLNRLPMFQYIEEIS